MNYRLRPYQQIIYNKIASSAKLKHKKILVLAPTGAGKTILAYIIAENAIAKGNRVLFTNHRIALAKQTFDKFQPLCPELLQGKNKLKNESPMLIIASLQTLINTEIQEPKIIIIDECHFGYKGDLIQSLFKKFPNALFIGLSATPVDDRDCLLNGWDVIIDDYQTQDLIDLKALTPFDCYAPVQIDLSSVKTTANDFNEDDLLDVITKENINKSVVENYIKTGENRLFIIFAVNKKHCYELQLEFAKSNIKTEIITADTSDKIRELYISQLKNNEIQGLISIEILTAGYDEPQVSCIIFATATMQWKKYIQCAGRGIRNFPGKIDCILLDFCGNIERHGLPNERKVFKFGKQISRVIDKQLNLSILNDVEKKTVTEEKQIYLKKIGKLLDLYDGKIYTKESDLQDDVNNYLKRAGLFFWRQNSGKAYMGGRWVHFASKSGLPDNTVFYKNSSFFFGLELKLATGYLTKHQRETLPEMIEHKVLFFIIESVFDVYLAIEHLENNITFTDAEIIIKNSIYELPENQVNYRLKLKI